MNAVKSIALVVMAAVVIGVIAPITATAATAYFSRVTTAKLTFSAYDPGLNSTPKTVWCPVGYKVMSGGVYGYDYYLTLDASWPVTNSAGRQGWSVVVDRSWPEPTTKVTIFAQCIR